MAPCGDAHGKVEAQDARAFGFLLCQAADAGLRRGTRPCESLRGAGSRAFARHHGPAPPARKRTGRTLLLVGAGLAALAAAGYYGHDYWTVGRFQVSTDDAYVQADSTTIAPKVSGYIGAVLVGDNER